jgi:hypothetical protein
MRPARVSDSPFPASLRQDPVRAAEEDIRRYLIRQGVLTPPPQRYANSYPSLFLLGIYAAIALIIFLGSLWLARMECDPVFMDRGFTVACRNRAGELAKIIGSAGNSYSNFVPANVLQ